MGCGANAGVAARLGHLEVQNQPQPSFYPAHQSGRYAPGATGKKIFVECDDLRDVGNRIPGQSGTCRRKKHVSRGVEQSCVRSENNTDDRSQPTTIKRVCLYHQDWSPESRSRSPGFVQFSPPDFASLDYHSLERTLRAWALCSLGSSLSDRSAKTSFSFMVTSSSRCFARYSARAVAYSSLRETPSLAARASADSNNSSDSEIAVFIPRLYQGIRLPAMGGDMKRRVTATLNFPSRLGWRGHSWRPA